jgi:hypothetical protein
MKQIGRYTLVIIAALAVAGCGGAGTAVPQGAMTQSRAHKASSSSGDLLYVTYGHEVYVLTFPTLKKVETFTPPTWLGFNGASNPNDGDMCFDNDKSVYLFAHGGTKPYAAIGTPTEGESNFDCAWDPTTNGLAITVDSFTKGTWVNVYTNPSGYPTTYSSPSLNFMEYAAYDGDGNLFVNGQGPSGGALVELPKGGNKLVTLSTGTLSPYGPLAWDGNYMTLPQRRDIYRFETSGSSLTIVGKTVMKDTTVPMQITIAGDLIVGDAINQSGNGHVNGRWLGLWNYPKGGKPYTAIRFVRKKEGIGTVLVSVAPSGPHIHK